MPGISSGCCRTGTRRTSGEQQPQQHISASMACCQMVSKRAQHTRLIPARTAAFRVPQPEHFQTYLDWDCNVGNARMRRKQRHLLALDARVYDVAVGQTPDLGVQVLTLHLQSAQHDQHRPAQHFLACMLQHAFLLHHAGASTQVRQATVMQWKLGAAPSNRHQSACAIQTCQPYLP